MDARFYNAGFAANLCSNTFKNLGNPVQIGGDGAGGVNGTDTALGLESVGCPFRFLPSSRGIKRKWSSTNYPVDQQIGSPLCLHLGNSSSSSGSKASSATACPSMSSAKETDEESSMDLELDFCLHLGNEKMPSRKESASFHSKSAEIWPKVDLELGLSSGPAESDITTLDGSSLPSRNIFNNPANGALRTDYDSSCGGGAGKRFHLVHTMQDASTGYFPNQVIMEIKPVTTPEPSSSGITPPKCSVTCTSGITQQQQQRSNSTKQCQFQGCIKGARGASGYCIAHGGGRRCQRPGCHKGAEGRTAFCKAHGGGRRCEFLGCMKSAEGRTDFCIAHGGGRRCSDEGCNRAARGKSGLCIRHGGGKRCQKENCTKSAEGLSGLCISHGGGRRCLFPECTKGAQGSTMFCKAHGGGKRCTFPGCTKGAEGSTPFCKGHGGGKRCSFEGGGICPKSVHGGTLFCVAHGGGKRCAVPECTKSARGRTDFCVRHGGGKRCKFDGCGKSAQGSTDFCKAHGCGKRCSWGQPCSEFGSGDVPCNSFSRGKSGLCASHGALVQDKRVHGADALGTIVQDSKPNKPEKMKGITIAEDLTTDNTNLESTPVSSVNGSWLKQFGMPGGLLGGGGLPSSSVSIPEGRVHGGSLLATLTGNSVLSSGSSRSSSSNNWLVDNLSLANLL